MERGKNKILVTQKQKPETRLWDKEVTKKSESLIAGELKVDQFLSDLVAIKNPDLEAFINEGTL